MIITAAVGCDLSRTAGVYSACRDSSEKNGRFCVVHTHTVMKEKDFMKFFLSAVACVLLAVGAWAQSPDQQESAPPSPPSGMHHEMGGPMMQQHMQEMKAQVESMRGKVEQMKSNLSKIKDPATRQQMQLDTDLWDAMVSHLENMQKMMSEHGMGGMHRGPHGPGGPPEPPAPPQ